MRLAELMALVCLPKKNRKRWGKEAEQTGPKIVAHTALQRFIFCYFRYKK